MDQDGGAGGSDPGQEPREEDAGFDRANPLTSFVRTVREVLFEPVGFFRRLPRVGMSWSPVVFALVCSLISAPFAFLAAPYDPLAGNEASFESFVGLFSDIRSSAGLAGVAAVAAIFLILAPLSALLGLFISAAIIHILVKIFVRPADTGFYTTLRVVCYTSATTLLSWIPVVGILASLYGLYLTFVGVREMHGTTTGRALVVIALPVVFFVIVAVLPLFPQSA